MKISPVAGAPTRSLNLDEGHSVGQTRLARARAIAEGQNPGDRGPAPDPQVTRTQDSIKRIKLRTQVSPDRHNRVEEAVPPVDPSAPAAVVPSATETDILTSNEPVDSALEEPKPLSPQFAALARQRREAQLATQKLEADRKAFETEKQGLLADYIPKADLKANALSVLLKEGVTYDQLTEQILASQADSPAVASLEAKIKALEDRLESGNKSQADRDALTEKQVLAQYQRETESLIAQGDDYEMIRESGYGPKVVDLIKRTFDKSGELLDVAEAANLIESELLAEAEKFARIKKVQSKLGGIQAPTTQGRADDRQGVKTMRTLTNRDGVSSTSMSKRERAIAAMEGRLK